MKGILKKIANASLFARILGAGLILIILSLLADSFSWANCALMIIGGFTIGYITTMAVFSLIISPIISKIRKK
jgi:hypothetical protein